MKRNIVFVAFITSMLFLSCDIIDERINGNGNLKSETRDVEDLKKIKVTGAIDAFVEQGESSVKVEGDENILQFIETKRDDGWLEIKTRDGVDINSKNPVRVYVTTPAITDLKVTGSGNISSDKKISSGNEMSFHVTGSGNIKADINAPAVNADITGSGNIFIKGETRNLDINVTGSGNYESPDLKAENAKVQISGSGDASLFADADLEATVAGSGDVKYRGNASVKKHIAGSGTVTQMP